MMQHRAIKVLKSHVVVDKKFRPRRVIMITANNMVELTETLNEYMERNPLTGTIYSTGFIRGENEYYALVRNTFDEPAASATPTRTIHSASALKLRCDSKKMPDHDAKGDGET